jgi:hypothetical protein
MISLYTDGTATKSAAISGWTKLEFDGSSTANLVIFWKVIATGDPGSNVTITGAAPAGRTGEGIAVSIEVWSGAQPPIAVFQRTNTGGFASMTGAVAGSIPFYVAALYDAATNAPSSLATPSGLSGSYLQVSTGPLIMGLGVFWGAPIAGSTISAQTASGATGGYGLFATIALPGWNSAILAGAQAGQDQAVQIILAGANAGADTNLVWTP